MADSLKPKCGSCSTTGTVNDAVPVNTSMQPSSCAPAPESTCDCPAPAITCPEDECSPCLEDHTRHHYIKKFAYTVKILNSFNWPANGEDVELYTQNTESLLPGSLLWNPTVGSLYIQSFNKTTQKIIARNKGDTCNIKTAGDLLPTCLEFAVGPVQCVVGGGGGSSTGACLAADFVAPAVDGNVLIKVSVITGLHINDIISIAGYEYRIGDILDDETVQLINDGDGAPEGTLIEADPNCTGGCQVPINVISSVDPCTRDSVNAGVVLACVEGTAQPLVGLIDGQILTWNNVTLRWELRNSSLPDIVCTTLTASLTVDPAHVGSYLLTVTDTTNFTATDKVIIAAVVYTVDDIVDGTHLHVTPDDTPGAIVTYPIGTALCLAGCCVTLQDQVTLINDTIINIQTDINNIQGALDNQGVNVYQAVSGEVTPGSVADTETFNGLTAIITIQNGSTSKTAYVFSTVDFYWYGAVNSTSDGDNGLFVSFGAAIATTVGTIAAPPADPVPGLIYTQIQGNDGWTAGSSWSWDYSYSISGVNTIAPLGELKIAALAQIGVSAVDANTYDYTLVRAVINAIQVVI